MQRSKCKVFPYHPEYIDNLTKFMCVKKISEDLQEQQNSYYNTGMYKYARVKWEQSEKILQTVSSGSMYVHCRSNFHLFCILKLRFCRNPKYTQVFLKFDFLWQRRLADAKS